VSDLHSRLEFAVRVAREAGDHTLRYFRRPDLEVESKADLSPVTRADREAETLLTERIRTAYPADGILGEELGETPSKNGCRWILDPIDGTRSFARGIPLFGTLVALEQDGKDVIGVIHLPACRETVYAAKGHGAWWQVEDASPEPARVSTVTTLSKATLLSTNPEGVDATGARNALRMLEGACLQLRTWGDCYGYALVATGRAEIMIDPRMAIWDAAALIPILEEAGGRFTDWSGNPIADGGNGIATNGIFHESVVLRFRNTTSASA